MAHPVSQDRAAGLRPQPSVFAEQHPLREAKVCHSINRFCKRGHLRTKETTFERKVRVKGKDYIVRECRICHSMRNSSSKTDRKNNSKWLRFVESQPA